ncbi:MAG TPA: hypothetical protein DIT01_02445, partial [Lentisphaeria bacterium]|nr:hypothetical protein [Lentisphaeria bacterium]
RPPRDERPRGNDDSEARLRSQAKDAAAEVRKWGEKIQLKLRDQTEAEKIVEMFNDDSEITAEATGDGKVMIQLRG